MFTVPPQLMASLSAQRRSQLEAAARRHGVTRTTRRSSRHPALDAPLGR